MEAIEKIIDTIRLENGFEIDLDEGWNKLTTSQFGGSPGRAFSELIQNAIDSYPSGTKWNDRKGEINTTVNTISITDWGEGLNIKRLKLLATAGGSDKQEDDDKIGRFGLGFISIFNPGLKTTRVNVVTKCDGLVVQMVFNVTDPLRHPEITTRILNKNIGFSTCITVDFEEACSVNECLSYAKKSLTYYPCSMKIDGTDFISEWQSDKHGLNLSFSEYNCDGIIKKGPAFYNINVLCRYEPVMNATLSHFVTGGHNVKYTLEDFAVNKTPFVPGTEVVFNINNLQLVISRDSYYLDANWRDAKRLLNLKLRDFLFQELEHSPQACLIVANQYIFGDEIRAFLKNHCDDGSSKEENKLIKLLAASPVYRINGNPGLFSLIQLYEMLSEGLPVYYSPERTNLRWLGGSFKYDYIIIPEKYCEIPGPSRLYDSLFESVFKDVVNLDRIASDHDKIRELVDLGIVDKSALSLKCEIIGIKDLNENQKNTIADLTKILGDKNIRDIIGNNLQIHIKRIKPVFFSVSDDGIYLSGGIFDVSGKPLSEEYISNFMEKSSDTVWNFPGKKRPDLLLGLNMSHPFIKFLVESNAPHKEYYTLTYLAHELAHSQKMLVPCSPFYHLVREKLAQDMRKALMKNLLSQLKN